MTTARAIPVSTLQPGDFLASFQQFVGSVAESPRYRNVFTVTLHGGHELRGLPGGELVEVTDDVPGPDTGSRLIFAEELRPGDRSVSHGGLTVLAVRDAGRREGVEVDFRDDDGRHDTWILHERELLHVGRLGTDPDDDDGHQAADEHQADDSYDPDAERW